jgi:hypothetical protein
MAGGLLAEKPRRLTLQAGAGFGALDQEFGVPFAQIAFGTPVAARPRILELFEESPAFGGRHQHDAIAAAAGFDILGVRR